MNNKTYGAVFLVCFLGILFSLLIIAHGLGMLSFDSAPKTESRFERVEFFPITQQMRFVCLGHSYGAVLQLTKCLDVKKPDSYAYSDNYIKNYECAHGLCREL